MAYRSGKASDIANCLAEAAATEEKHRGEGGDNPWCTPWMPFNLFDFCALLTEALPSASSHVFLDVGCGPGSKVMVAKHVYGLDAHGFDIVPELVGEARAAGLSVRVADALDWDYSGFGIIMFNRTFKDNALQARLEAKVWQQASPGTLAICAHLDAPPRGWFPVVDDWEARRGVWQKPDR